MDRPQQMELQRSGHTPLDPDDRKAFGPARALPTKGRAGRLPPDNRPGHHPPREQDRPRWAGGVGQPHRSFAESASKAQLYAEAQRLGIRRRSRMTKAELADAITKHDTQGLPA